MRKSRAQIMESICSETETLRLLSFVSLKPLDFVIHESLTMEQGFHNFSIYKFVLFGSVVAPDLFTLARSRKILLWKKKYHFLF